MKKKLIGTLLLIITVNMYSQNLPPAKSYYPITGTVMERYSEDAQGNKHGLYINYNPYGLKVIEANFVHGVKTGNVKKWQDNGVLFEDFNYLNDEKNGLCKEIGTEYIHLETYKNGVLNGMFEKREFVYNNYTFSKTEISLAKTTLVEKGNYTNSLKNGVWTICGNGVCSNGKYLDNLKVGVWTNLETDRMDSSKTSYAFKQNRGEDGSIPDLGTITKGVYSHFKDGIPHKCVNGKGENYWSIAEEKYAREQEAIRIAELEEKNRLAEIESQKMHKYAMADYQLDCKARDGMRMLLNRFPESKYASELKPLVAEEDEYKNLQTYESIKDIEIFLTKYPNSCFKDLALVLKNQIIEKANKVEFNEILENFKNNSYTKQLDKFIEAKDYAQANSFVDNLIVKSREGDFKQNKYSYIYKQFSDFYQRVALIKWLSSKLDESKQIITDKSQYKVNMPPGTIEEVLWIDDFRVYIENTTKKIDTKEIKDLKKYLKSL